MKANFEAFFLLQFLAFFISSTGLSEVQVDPVLCQQDIEQSAINATELAHISSVRLDPNNPDTIIFGGTVTSHFLNVLKELPSHIKRVALENSAGGEAYSALLIAQQIRAMGLETYVGLTRCHSACTIIYQGGARRVADPQAVFSYHGPSGTGGSNENTCSVELRRAGVELVTQYGFSPQYTHVFNSNNSINYVFGASLMEYGVVHEFQSLNIGRDEQIRTIENARREYCKNNPDHDDC